MVDWYSAVRSLTIYSIESSGHDQKQRDRGEKFHPMKGSLHIWLLLSVFHGKCWALERQDCEYLVDKCSHGPSTAPRGATTRDSEPICNDFKRQIQLDLHRFSKNITVRSK